MNSIVQSVAQQFKAGLKREGKELAISIGRGLIVTAGLWATQKLANRTLRRQEDEEDFDVTKQLKTKAIGHITDRIVEVTVGKKEGLKGSNELNPQDISICDFLKGRTEPQVFYSLREEAFSFPSQHVAMIQVMFHRFWHERCKIEKAFYWSGRDKCLSPTLKSIQIGEKESYQGWVEGCIYGCFENKKIVMRLDMWTLGGNITIYSDHHYVCRDVLSTFREFLQKENYLKGRVVDTDGLLMDITACPDWDDILLPDELKQKVQHHTITFLKKISVLRKKGLRTCRGSLWRGIPGVGKTMTAKIIARNCEGMATFLATNGGHIREGEELTAVFTMARWLAPTILLLDDIDRMSSNLQEMLLSELDGMRNNDGLVVIATANNIAALGGALANRPNRFDLVVDFPPPSLEVRRELFAKLLEQIPHRAPAIATSGNGFHHLFSESQLQELIDLTEGLSAIHCEEIIRRARIEAICQDDNDEENLTAASILEVAEQVVETFHAISQEIGDYNRKDPSIASMPDAPVTCSVAPSSSGSLYRDE